MRRSDKAPNKYALYLGAKYDGTRLNSLILPSATSEDIIAYLTPLIRRYALEKIANENFGDFCHRTVLAEQAASAPVAVEA